MAEELKTAGNALFASGACEAAVAKYTAALELKPPSDLAATVLCNRAACLLPRRLSTPQSLQRLPED